MSIAPIAAREPPEAPRPIAAHHASFLHTLLSELNPLQYVPILGTLYRAVSGDTIPEAARTGGALVVGFLTGGPIGVAATAAMVAVEHATGIDPERIGRSLLADAGIGAAPVHTVTLAPAVVVPAQPDLPVAWSVAQLKAFGVTTTPSGTLQRGTETGSDVLNGLELARLDSAVPDANRG